jgi:Haem-binding domain
MNIKKTAAIALVFCAAALLAAQFIRTPVTNPTPAGQLAAPPDVEAILRRSCYDCHSSQTRWPWYSRIAPLSWLVWRDVERGRREVNFSDWGAYYPATRRRKLQWMGRALHEEIMPPLTYLVMHPTARLTPRDRAVLEQWIGAQLSHP